MTKPQDLIDKDSLLKAYIIDNHSLKECAELFNTTVCAIRVKLKKYDIKKPISLQKERREKTNLVRYGCKNSAQNDQIKEKAKRTNQKKYGGNAPACDKAILNKIKGTNKERYGEEWSWKTEEGKEKRKQAWIDQYGVDNPLKAEKIQEKGIQTKLEKYGRSDVGQFGTKEHDDSIKAKYGVDHIAQNSDVQIKTKKTVKDKYGVDCILILPENQKKAKDSIQKKYGTNTCWKDEEVIRKSEEGRKKWRESEEYPQIRKEMTEKAWNTRKAHGNCNSSKAEAEIFNLLKYKYKEVKQNYKSELYPFHCDFYIPEKDLYIEFQGDFSHGKQGNTVLGPYDPANEKHLEILDKWKDGSRKVEVKSSSEGHRNRYSNAIEVWTIKDPLKRQTAKNNNLIWLKFFTFDEFLTWFNS